MMARPLFGIDHTWKMLVPLMMYKDSLSTAVLHVHGRGTPVRGIMMLQYNGSLKMQEIRVVLCVCCHVCACSCNCGVM